MNTNYDYDMVIIGSGPGGQKAAIQGAKLGKRVLIIDANPQLGGACLQDGTIPSKSFREAILHLSGYRERSHYGKAYRVKQNVEMADLTSRNNGIINNIEQTIRSQLSRNNITIINGFGSIEGKNQVRVRHGKKEEVVHTEFIIVCTGTTPFHPPGFDVDAEVILDSDSILRMEQIPRSISIVGGGVIGCEYGSMLATLGCKVTIVEARNALLGFIDHELVDVLVYKLREQKVSIILNDKVTNCKRSPDGRAVTYLESGKRLVTDVLLISAGRNGNVKNLGLEAVGIFANERGIIKVNENYQTNIENIYAVGDVIGSPALASTAIEQGRKAACHACGITDIEGSLPTPYGIYTIPEIAMVGKTENELSKDKIPYETGISRFSEVERGKIIGDDTGVLKILFHRNTLQILGIHIVGENAAELIHIGQMIMGFQGTIDFLARSVFNYPTLSQAYKTAALDGLNKVIATEGLPDESEYLDFNTFTEATNSVKQLVS
jgi:NAD(P) transhydrogenase